MRALLGRVVRNRSGAYATMTAVLAVPLLVSVGLAVDYTRLSSAHSRLQELADGASLTLAASKEQDETKLRQMAVDFVSANLANARLDHVEIVSLSTEDAEVDIELKANVPMSFMQLANITSQDIGASALAKRAVNGSVEVALILDNTWSMSDKDVSGKAKIDTLKQAASSLVSQLFSNKEAEVRIGLVPYADYVNVGTKYRNASWLSIPADYEVQPKPKTCETKTTKSVCVATAPKYSCNKVVDGVSEPATCGGGCTKSETQTVPPYQSCTGGGSPTKYTWFGCVGSRIKNNNRLHDKDGTDKYPGYLGKSQTCLNPIVPLTNSELTLQAAIKGMIINIGSYKPLTFIPAGLVWGQNILSSPEPFTEGAAYDPKNLKPRKVAVLMTDGENTLQFNQSDGKHVPVSTNAATAPGQIKKTNKETAELCAYMKSNGIEIFSVAFMVKSADAKALLEGCATDPAHYYDASDPEKLIAAFSNIAQSLSVVRLAR